MWGFLVVSNRKWLADLTKDGVFWKTYKVSREVVRKWAGGWGARNTVMFIHSTRACNWAFWLLKQEMYVFGNSPGTGNKFRHWSTNLTNDRPKTGRFLTPSEFLFLITVISVYQRTLIYCQLQMWCLKIHW